MPDYQFVDLKTDETLAELIAEEQRIAVDTEFMREKTFYSQLCLLQVAAQSKIVCADPLGLSDADPKLCNGIWQSIMQPEWVLHSGRQDIEVIYQTCGLLPHTLFDTQVAAALLGYQPQIGYAGLVKELFGIELPKSHTRADWSKRPLADAVLNYAAEDVEYLLPACDRLSDRLVELGRFDWAVEDSMYLLDVALYDPDPDIAVDRLKGARNLRGRARAAATKIAAWREREAIRTNRPRQWIMRDTVLLDIAVSRPKERNELGKIEGLAESTIRRVGDKLLTIVADATDDESNYLPPLRPDERQKAMLKKIQKIVSETGESLGLATEIVAPKKELSAAMLGNRESRVFRGWRRDVVGTMILEVLENP